MDPSEQERDKANARLIAAAPETAAERDRLRIVNAELLKVLENCITDDNAYCMTKGDTSALIRRLNLITGAARAAIAAATGGGQ